MAKKESQKLIKIGTRDSELALWQAKKVAQELESLGFTIQLIPVKAAGDIILDKPLYELGITGIFTKSLDIALLQGEIDIAVHSMKDVPTALPKGIIQAAVLKRAATEDVLVYNGTPQFLSENVNATIATGSLRRKAQWLYRFSNHNIVDIRGNVNTRLKKLEENNWEATIFAKAGLERIDKLPQNHITLDWMIPAPAQGAMMVVCKENDFFALDVLSSLNDIETEICTYIERQFLKTLEGGCTAPIGCNVKYNENEDVLHFNGIVLTLDGKQKCAIEDHYPLDSWKNLGANCALKILEGEGATILKSIKKQLNQNL